MNSIFYSNRAIALFLLLLAACTGYGAPVQAPVSQAARIENGLPYSVPTVVPAVPTVRPTPVPTAIPTSEPVLFVPTVASDKPLLVWEGTVQLGASDLTECKSMEIGIDHSVLVGDCKLPLQSKTAIRQEMVLDLLARLAPFEFKTDKEHLVFRGQGKEADPIWQQAVLDWVHTTYSELSTGHVCAACNTVFTWSLGGATGQPGTCKLVYVLAWGYANAVLVPCTGGTSTELHSRWLTTEEWKTLRDLTANFAINPDLPYTEQGSHVPNNDELTDKLNTWSRGIYEQLARQ